MKEHVLVLQEFVAEQVTGVVPTAKVLPDAGVHETDGAGEPPDIGAKVTTVLQVTISEGQVITGLVLIVTLNEQDDDPHEFVAVQVTAVVPVAKVEPDAGTQVTDAAGVPDDVGVEKVAT